MALKIEDHSGCPKDEYGLCEHVSDEAREITKHFRQAVDEAIKKHHAAGHSVPIWRDGKIIHIWPDGSEHDERKGY